MRAKARVATGRAAGQQGLLAEVSALTEVRQDHLVPGPVGREHLYRSADHDVRGVTELPFAEDQRRGGEPDDLRDLGERAELGGVEIGEEVQLLEELLAFRRNHRR